VPIPTGASGPTVSQRPLNSCLRRDRAERFCVSRHEEALHARLIAQGGNESIRYVVKAEGTTQTLDAVERFRPAWWPPLPKMGDNSPPLLESNKQCLESVVTLHCETAEMAAIRHRQGVRAHRGITLAPLSVP
jgi:hypothetical protein